MSEELNPERPLPWKAVAHPFYHNGERRGDIWDVTNDAGDPREEFSVFEYATEGEARFIVRACNAHADLLAACEAFVAADNHDGITPAYNMARAAIAKATGAS